MISSVCYVEETMLAGHHNHIRPFDTLHISLEIRILTYCFISQFIMSNYMSYLMVIAFSAKKAPSIFCGNAPMVLVGGLPIINFTPLAQEVSI